jgi:hypothetical protein
VYDESYVGIPAGGGGEKGGSMNGGGVKPDPRPAEKLAPASIELTTWASPINIGMRPPSSHGPGCSVIPIGPPSE